MNSRGLSSFGLDWNTVAGFLGSPLAIPGFAIINLLIGFVLDIYVVIPVANWSNLYDAKKFPLISSHTFDSTGAIYNVTRILNPITFEIDLNSYNNYSKIYLSNAFVFEYGLGFATLIATISHVALFHGEMILQVWRKTTRTLKEQLGDVHTRIKLRTPLSGGSSLCEGMREGCCTQPYPCICKEAVSGFEPMTNKSPRHNFTAAPGLALMSIQES